MNAITKGLSLIVFSLISISCSFAQDLLSVDIPWASDELKIYKGTEITLPSLETKTYKNTLPNFHLSKKISNSSFANYEIVSFETTSSTSSDLTAINLSLFKISTIPEITIKNTFGAGQNYFVMDCIPYVYEDGAYKRITKIFYRKTKGKKPSNQQKAFAAESQLRAGTGTWIKLSVNADGIYRINKSDLISYGIDVNSLDPRSINIFGNAEGKMPELNSVVRHDDLNVNAIKIIGEEDGVFDDDDYILFYGYGPNRIYAQGTNSFSQVKNIYSDVNCYFLNVDPSKVPVRITEIPQSSASANYFSTSYNYYAAHELDLVNLVGGGQRWYGESFDGSNLNRTIAFSVPNPEIGASATVNTAFACSEKSGTKVRYSNNGSLLGEVLFFSSADYPRNTSSYTFPNSSSSINIGVEFIRASPDVAGYLDRIDLNTRRKLVFTGPAMHFVDFQSANPGNVTEFTVSNVQDGYFLWEISDRLNPKAIVPTISGTDLTFTVETDTVKYFVVSNNEDFLSPSFMKNVTPQNLHALPAADYLIVTNSIFMEQANRLADLHRATGMSVHVVTTEQVFNEFSSGVPDPVAIRWFAKMFYDRANGDTLLKPKYMCLFGDGTYDPKNRVANNNNYVMTYQVVGPPYGEDHIGNLVTDDFYAMLDDDEAISSSDKIDIAVGRLLASDQTTAKQLVNKIEHYLKNGSSLFANDNVNCFDGVSTSTFGDWRTKVVNIGDDEEYGYFLNVDLEPAYDTLSLYHPELNLDKIYLDAYTQISTAGGHRYPEVVKAIDDRFTRGALVINYVGHGGEVGVAEERVITVPQIQEWSNIDNLPLMVSATCEFTKYDDPDRVSAGEWVSLNPKGGAIALMTTSRSVYFSVNSNTVEAFYQNVFDRNDDFQPLTFGDILLRTKNAINDGDNKRSFTLIGDPALQIALPRQNIVIDSINGNSPAIVVDTLKALSYVTIKGHLEDFNGNILNGFNGVLSPSIYDKAKSLQTLGQDPKSPVIPFELQKNILYKGKVTVNNGYFSFDFIVPKDIDYNYGNGKISLYANNSTEDAIGKETRVLIGGVDPNGIDDNVGPDIELYLNNENFANGGLTDNTPFLIANIFDENGINTVGNGIGHDIMVIMDENTSDPIVLNDYYTANLDSYQSGQVRYQFEELTPGEHTLTFKIWDVNNNSASTTLDFVVQESDGLELKHVLNYPNPFTTHTEFFFEHNQCCTDLEVQIQIFTISGRLVKTINQPINTTGFRSEGIAWDGKDDFGDQLAKGVYVYRLIVKMPDGQKQEKLEKLVLLK